MPPDRAPAGARVTMTAWTPRTSARSGTPSGSSSGSTSYPSRSRSRTPTSIPDELRAQAAEMGLFGFAIPEEYGGIGLTWRGRPARLRARLHHARVPVAVRHQQRHRRARAARRRHRGTAEHLAAAAGLRRGDRVLRAHRTRRGLRPVGPAPPAPSATATTGCITGSQALHHQRAAGRRVHGLRPHRPRRRARRAASPPSSSPPTRPASPSARSDHKMGQRGAWTSDVHLDEVRVPAANLIGGDDGLDRASAPPCAAWPTAGCTSPRCASAWPSGSSTSRFPLPGNAVRAAT